MSGIYIHGMEMPISCAGCFNRGCGLWREVELPAHERHKYCPLVSVPPHGDLIDRDALIKEIDKQENAMYEHGREFSFSFKSGGDVCTAWYNVEMMVEDAPTIIPASEEGK